MKLDAGIHPPLVVVVVSGVLLGVNALPDLALGLWGVIVLSDVAVLVNAVRRRRPKA